MPEKTRCPRCAVVGDVRVEHVIQAGHSYRSFECNACGHAWRVLETGEHVPMDHSEHVDRSRSRPPETGHRSRR